MTRRYALLPSLILIEGPPLECAPATQEEILAELAAAGFTEERLERIFVNTERNDEYFRAHETELFDQYPDKALLIHSGGIVEAFDDIAELSRRRDELGQDAADGAIRRKCRHHTVNWIM